MKKLAVNKVAVLGAGVMGAQIAAHFANCKHEVFLYDLPGRAALGLKTLTKLKPSPLASKLVINNIKPCDYDGDLRHLKECNWIVEAVAEDIKIKADLYEKIIPYINENAIITSNTSGLSVNNLAEVLSSSANGLAKRFCGVHFFNPPRYQKLVEIIPHAHSNLSMIDSLEQYIVRYLGKGVVRAKDTPNFIANRIGVFSMLATMHYAREYNIGFDTVDVLTGELIGRPKSGTYRTADVVGLDTLAKVIDTMTVSCKNDPWHSLLITPDYLQDLINKGCLGQKTQKGFYYKDREGIHVLDINSGEYIPATANVKNLPLELLEILKIKSMPERFAKLKDFSHPYAKFLWSCFREVWCYSAYHLSAIADSVACLDNALKWGFGWQQGPFEIWQSAGWNQITKMIQQDISAKLALTSENLPDWTLDNEIVYENNLSLSSSTFKFVKNSPLDVYNRQLTIHNPEIILENDAAKLWRCVSKENNIDNLVFSFKTKLNIVNTDVLKLLSESIDYISSHENYNNLVLWQDSYNNFSAGADLNGFLASIESGDYKTMDDALILIQNVGSKMRYSNIPVVAAVQGLALGGGCELVLHCDRVVAALESYIGLVEVGVGVIPAGGGCKEMVLRANQKYAGYISNKVAVNSDKLLEFYFTNIATAAVSSSSLDALEKGYLKDTDICINNNDELLFVAINTANNMSESNYLPPCKQVITAGGDRLKGVLLNILANYHAGGFISGYDNLLLEKLAWVITGAGIDSGCNITEEWLLTKEREVFLSLLKNTKTQERITHMLTKGKALRN